MAVDHVVLFQTKPDAAEADVKVAIDGLNALRGQIAEIRSWAIREDIGKRDGSYRFALLARFDDLAAVERYLAHPAHVAAVQVAAPLMLLVAEHDHVVEPG